MILVTNGTGFVGRAIVHRLVGEELQARCLLRPFRREQRLPKGVPFSSVSASLADLPALRTTMQDVTAIIHLTGEDDPAQLGLLEDHPQETINLIEAAQEVGVRRFVYVSRLGADRASAYPLFRTVGEVESIVRESGLDWTILQTAIIYGSEDAFINVLAMLAKTIPFVLPIPEAGLVRFQPLWVEDMARCAVAALRQDDLIGQTIPLGGPEHFTLEQLVLQVLLALRIRRRLVRMRVPMAQAVIRMLDGLLPHTPTPPRWLDVLAVGSATDLGTIPRHFGFEPCRFAQGLEYLHGRHPWRRDLVRFVLGYR